MSNFIPLGYTPQVPDDALFPDTLFPEDVVVSKEAAVVLSRDPLQGFSKPMWQRFFKHAGALRANAEVYETVRQILVTRLRPVLKRATLQTELKGCKTVDAQMVRVALEGPVLRVIETVTLPADVCFPTTPFDRVMRGIINEYRPDTRVSATASKMLKESYEKIMLCVIKRAASNAARAKRATLSPQDFS